VTTDELAAQEALRRRMYDPQRRWCDLMAFIAWAERTQVHRATVVACLAKQRRLETGLKVRR
jgi:hypothetical protein